MIKVAIVCGVIVFIGLMVYLVLTWSSRFGGRIVGTWITETPNEYIHKITFYGDNSGYMEGPNGEGRFNWSGDERAIVIAPYDPDYSQDGSSQENFDFKISISEDGDILRIDIDKPGDTFQFHRAD